MWRNRLFRLHKAAELVRQLLERAGRSAFEFFHFFAVRAETGAGRRKSADRDSGYHTYQNIGLFMRTKHGFEPPFHLLGFNMRRFAENIKKSFMKEVIQI